MKTAKPALRAKKDSPSRTGAIKLGEIINQRLLELDTNPYRFAKKHNISRELLRNPERGIFPKIAQCKLISQLLGIPLKTMEVLQLIGELGDEPTQTPSSPAIWAFDLPNDIPAQAAAISRLIDEICHDASLMLTPYQRAIFMERLMRAALGAL